MKLYIDSILKDSNNTTIGARIRIDSVLINVNKYKLMEYYNKGVKFENAVLLSNGTVRGKNKKLPVIIVKDISNKKTKILYHGSLSGIEGRIKASYSSRTCDFGSAFYLGEQKIQAINRVCNSKDSKVYTMELEYTDAKVYEFNDSTLWSLFIGVDRGFLDVRRYKKLDNLVQSISSNDIVIGLIADDKIAQSYTQFLEGNITDKALSECLKYVKYGRQYAIKNQKFCEKNRLRIKECKFLSKQDKEKARNWGRQVRANMNQELDEIKKKYRRNGRYIDEILEDFK